jgi:hypothetical protein
VQNAYEQLALMHRWIDQRLRTADAWRNQFPADSFEAHAQVSHKRSVEAFDDCLGGPSLLVNISRRSDEHSDDVYRLFHQPIPLSMRAGPAHLHRTAGGLRTTVEATAGQAADTMLVIGVEGGEGAITVRNTDGWLAR